MKKAKFKMTEIGPIPKDWEVKRLGEIGEFIAGNGFPLNKQGWQSGKYPFFKVSDFNNVGNESALSIANNYISVSTFNELHCSLIPSGSIVFAKIGAAIALERKRRVCQDSCIDNNMMAFCVNKQNDERFVTECLRRIVFADLVESTALPALNVRKLREYKIIVPENISEQRAIAEALSDVDELLTAMTTLIEKKRAIKQGAMQELLTGKKRLPGFGGKWIEKRLGDCALIKARIGWQGLTTDEYLENGPYYLITGSDFRDGKVDWSQCYYVDKSRYEQDKNIQIQKNDVLVSKDGTIGKVAFLDEIPGEGTLNSGVFVIRTRDKEIEQLYMAWVFLSKWFDDFINRLVAGSTIVHLYQKDIVGFEFPVPPTIAEQKAIAEVLSDMDAEIEALEAKRAKYESIKQSMMQELLTGKTRLV